MSELVPIRGVVAALNAPRSPFAATGSPAEAVQQLVSAFDEFKAQNNTKLADLAGAMAGIDNDVDALNSALAAYKVGGAGDDVPDNLKNGPAINAAVEFMRTGSVKAMAALPKNGMSTDSDPDGGFTAPAEVDKVIQFQLATMSPMRNVARVVSTRSKEYSIIINRRGASSGWVGERETRGETDNPQLGLITPPMGEVFAQPEITQRLIDDSSFDLATFLNENVSDEFSEQEGAAFLTGDGINKPLGLLTFPTASTGDAVRAFGTLQYVPTGVANNIADATHNGVDALINLVHAVRPSYRAGPGVGWMMNSATAAIIRKLKSKTDETYLWQPSVIEGQPDKLLGYPIFENEFFSDIGANAYPIAFGNWRRGYVVVDRHELRLLRDPYTKKGYVKFYFTRRVGGSPTDTNAIKLLKCAAS